MSWESGRGSYYGLFVIITIQKNVQKEWDCQCYLDEINLKMQVQF